MFKRSPSFFFVILSCFIFAVFVPSLHSASVKSQDSLDNMRAAEANTKSEEKEVTHDIKPQVSNNNPKKFYRYSSRKKFNLRSETAMLNDSSKLLVPRQERIRSNKKRCRYSDNEIEYLNLLNKNKQSQLASANGYNSHYYMNANPQQHIAVKQPRTRDQFNNRPNSNSNANEYSIETQPELMYVDVGDLINLTCHVNTREIDWHFKDKNLTTTVISYGLELQVIQPIYIDTANPDPISTYDKFNKMSRRSGAGQHRILKYKVTSDKQFTHMLSVFVQGEQDEGTYQCIDSKSETPLIKTIRIILKNDSRALNVGFVNNNKSALIYIIVLSILKKSLVEL